MQPAKPGEANLGRQGPMCLLQVCVRFLGQFLGQLGASIHASQPSCPPPCNPATPAQLHPSHPALLAHHAGRAGDDLHAGVGRVVLAVALLAVVVPHVVQVLLVKLLAGSHLGKGVAGQGRAVLATEWYTRYAVGLVLAICLLSYDSCSSRQLLPASPHTAL